MAEFPVECCGRTWETLHAYNSHRKSHAGKKPCRFCGKPIRHMARHEKACPQRTPEPEPEESDEVRDLRAENSRLREDVYLLVQEVDYLNRIMGLREL